MLPDLASYQCTHIVASSRVSRGLNASVVRRLTGEKLQAEGGPVAEESYQASGEEHNIRVFILKRGRSPYVVVHIDCLLDMDGVPPNSRDVGDLLEDLKSLNLTAEWHFDMMFILGSAASKAVFPIRLPVFGDAGMDEIRGLKGVKYEDASKKIKYELSIESPDLKELFLNVEFHRREAFDIEMIRQALREGNGVVRAIIPTSGWSD